MTTRVIRRSAARDLPPDADSDRLQPSVTSSPAVGARVRVNTFCGVTVDAVIREIRHDESGWLATARMTEQMQLALIRRAGVPTRSLDEDFTVFDWQII